MAEQISFKERVRQALISNSRQYKYYFTDYEYLLCSDAFKKNPYYIVTAEEDNYLHLTGVLSHVSAQVFFDKCFNATLSDADFEVAGTHNGQDLKGTIRRKINVIPNIFGIFSASTTVQEDFHKNRISCSFATGNITCTLGFAGTTAAHPKTLLKGNELDSDKSSNLVIVLRRSAGKDKFGEVLVGDTDDLLNYYDDLKPLLSDKITAQLDKIIEDRKKEAGEHSSGNGISSSDEPDAEANKMSPVSGKSSVEDKQTGEAPVKTPLPKKESYKI